MTSGRRTDLHDVVITGLARVTDHEVDAIADDTLLDELGFDSLLFTGLLLEVEDELGVQYSAEALSRIDDGALADVLRVSDLIRVLTDALGPAEA